MSMDVIPHCIDGRRGDSVSATRHGYVFDPALGRVKRKVGLAAIEDVDAAVRLAARAFISWSEVSSRDVRRSPSGSASPTTPLVASS
jgi:acyl-CoA reductase-like NAD-dependent aldehyde dehydrogenase